MGTRTLYSCDWCMVDAPQAGSIGEGWAIVQSPERVSDSKVTLCAACHKTCCDAWSHARHEAASRGK